MLKIRLMRIGGRQKPFYRVVAVDERSKRTGAYIELLGTYNPLTEPKDIKLKQDRIDYWLKQGAQKSDGFLRIIGEAPQRKPRKPKKEKKAAQPAVVSDQPSGKKEEPASTEPAAQPTETPSKEQATKAPVVEEAPATEEAAQQAETPTVETPSEETASTVTESPNNEKEEVVEGSTSSPQANQADEPVPSEVEGSESIQNEKVLSEGDKNEGST